MALYESENIGGGTGIYAIYTTVPSTFGTKTTIALPFGYTADNCAVVGVAIKPMEAHGWESANTSAVDAHTPIATRLLNDSLLVYVTQASGWDAPGWKDSPLRIILAKI